MSKKHVLTHFASMLLVVHPHLIIMHCVQNEILPYYLVHEKHYINGVICMNSLVT